MNGGTEYAYDPTTPYVVAGAADILYARFRHEDDAQAWADCSGLLMIDTTPKPKIPEDAVYIAWDGYTGVNMADKTEGFWTLEGAEVSVEELLYEIGDAEVTVLVPKEES